MTFDDTYKCRAAIRYYPADYTTEVKWIMKGNMDMPVFGGYFALMMDSMVGPMFDRGLAKLKQVVEKIRDLQALTRPLRALIQACRAGQPTDRCPILRSFEGERRRTDGNCKATR